MPYEAYVGLLLNKHRIRRQWALAVLAGLAANNTADLDPSWGDAAADDPLEGQELTFEANRQRRLARFRKKPRPGL